MARIDPKNMTAQFSYRAAGNPPSILPEEAISNFFPGLEFDLRSIWKHIFVGIELHEAGTRRRRTSSAGGHTRQFRG